MKGIVLTVMTVGIVQVLSGCTIIGAALGSSQDSRLRDYRPVGEWYKEEALKVGVDIRIRTTDGKVLLGKYGGNWQKPLCEYEELYDLIRDAYSERVALPLIHERLGVGVDPEKTFDGEFLGFDPQNIWLRKFGSETPQLVPLETIRGIENGSAEKIDLVSIKQLLLEGRLPYRSGIIIKKRTRIQRIPLDTVVELQIKTKKYGWLYGLITGAVLDAAVIGGSVLVISFMAQGMREMTIPLF